MEPKMEPKMESSLRPIRLPLQALKVFGGLPLTISFNEGQTDVKFSCLEGIKTFALILVLYCSWLALSVYDGFSSLTSDNVS